MKICCILEHNGGDSLIYARDLVGAYARGKSPEEALEKMPAEAESYLAWLGREVPEKPVAEIVETKASSLEIRDADSDVIFEAEKLPLTPEEYVTLKNLALKSAWDFHALYLSVSDKSKPLSPARKTFYGELPRSAEEMYEHTKRVNSYYFGEINAESDNNGNIYECRARGFENLEKMPDFLENRVVEGSYGELWSLRKVIRRFVWHDRIHARAMYRGAVRSLGAENVTNVFCFSR